MLQHPTARVVVAKPAGELLMTVFRVTDTEHVSSNVASIHTRHIIQSLVT